MCGISGFSWNDEDLLRKMNNATKFRGPDDKGTFFDEYVSLGHTRLSIIDLSSRGHQPMTNEDRTIWITYNGEIYNFQNLRDELKNLGHVFSSNTDTEVVLHAYEEYGVTCMNKFDGMWAFCIYDTSLQKLILGRDPFGIKPLYYYVNPERLIFSSMISAILVHGIPTSPNERMIMQYLAYNLEDHTNETFFTGIYRILPGHFLTYDLNTHRYSIKKWFTNLTVKDATPQTLRTLFEKSVRARTLADVPVGSCLSGGVDSSSIVAVLKRVLDHPFCTFSLIIPRHPMDESRYIHEMGVQTNADQYFTTIEPQDILNEIEDFISAQEEPVTGMSPYAQYRVMKLAHEHGAKVLLDGQGGDELFAGYTYYFAYYFLELICGLKWWTLCKEAWMYWKNFHNLLPHGMVIFILLPRTVQKILWNRCMVPWINLNYLKQCLGKNVDPRWHPMNLHQCLFLTLTCTAIPHLLRWEDKSAMRWSIESRPPFLDVHLVNAALSISSEKLLNGGRTKVIFRQAMKDFLPELIIKRTDKIGFDAPVNELFRDDQIIRFCNDIINGESFKARPYWRWKEVDKWVKRHQLGTINIGDTIWKWINLELWLRQFFPQHRD
jgi:asparagine synthase (glutamine-hydrolysing)